MLPIQTLNTDYQCARCHTLYDSVAEGASAPVCCGKPADRMFERIDEESTLYTVRWYGASVTRNILVVALSPEDAVNLARQACQVYFSGADTDNYAVVGSKPLLEDNPVAPDVADSTGLIVHGGI